MDAEVSYCESCFSKCGNVGVSLTYFHYIYTHLVAETLHWRFPMSQVPCSWDVKNHRVFKADASLPQEASILSGETGVKFRTNNHGRIIPVWEAWFLWWVGALVGVINSLWGLICPMWVWKRNKRREWAREKHSWKMELCVWTYMTCMLEDPRESSAPNLAQCDPSLKA